MAIDLATNLRAAINNHPVHVHCWLNSMVALHWINGKREDRQFVSNRMSKIQQQVAEPSRKVAPRQSFSAKRGIQRRIECDPERVYRHHSNTTYV